MRKFIKHSKVLAVMCFLLLGSVALSGCGKKDELTKNTENAKTEETQDAEEMQDAEEVQVPEEEPEVTKEPVVTEEPETIVPEKPEIVGNGKKVAIDAGHQGHGNSNQEPIGPGASQTKARVTSGTSGRTTGVPEYVLNLDVSLKLKEELLERGYEVYMIRETHEIDISNSERAKAAADSGADILVRIHANGSDNTSVAGALTMSPSMSNQFLSSELVEECQKLSADIIETFCAATGANNQGVYQTDTMSGLNWCTIPATIVEMGYMTNPEEDTKMQTEEYQALMVHGIADGIDQYFGFNE